MISSDDFLCLILFPVMFFLQNKASFYIYLCMICFVFVCFVWVFFYIYIFILSNKTYVGLKISPPNVDYGDRCLIFIGVLDKKWCRIVLATRKFIQDLRIFPEVKIHKLIGVLSTYNILFLISYYHISAFRGF